MASMAAEVVRRLSGEKTEASAVFNLNTQLGGVKTHALSLLYHLAKNGPKAESWDWTTGRIYGERRYRRETVMRAAGTREMGKKEKKPGGAGLRDPPSSGEPLSIEPGEGPEGISGRFSLIGDVAVVSIPPSFEGDKSAVGEAITSRHKNVRTVLNKISKLEGDRRVASFELLAGGGTVTCHREYGFSYRLDVARVFFNPRLGSERMRVASMVRPGQRSIVPFAGVGTFAIPLAAAGARVLAIEINPEACRWMAENVGMNGVGGMVDVVKGDAFALCRAMAKRSPADACEGTVEEKMGKMEKRTEKKKGTGKEEKKEKRQGPGFDRAVVPTPYGRDEILDSIIPLVRPGGSITFYTFKKRTEIGGLIREFEGLGLAVGLHRRCGNVAPGVSRWAFDMVKL